MVLDADGKPMELGRGAMGVTYKAFDVDLHCPVTLKVISERYLEDESARHRFLREARSAASVRHPNVASVFHLGRTGQNYFYAMEFVEGETLENLIKRFGRLEIKVALEIATQVAAGLAAIHKRKLVHRDIKPSNIMVSLEEGGAVIAKIIDLGLAKPAPDAGPAEAAISAPGAFAGTPEFASPEQFAGIGVDIRSDLYSLGVTLWTMLAGQAPFRGSSAEVMYQQQHAPLPLDRLGVVPQPVIVLIEVLLEKDPRQRFRNPAELLQAIPTITGAIDARRRITRQNLGRPPPASRIRTRKSPARLARRRFPWPDYPLPEVMFLVEKGISLFWIVHGQTRMSTSLRLWRGAESENQRWSIIGSDEWPLNSIVLRNSYLAGLSTDRAAAATLRLPMNFSTPL